MSSHSLSSWTVFHQCEFFHDFSFHLTAWISCHTLSNWMVSHQCGLFHESPNCFLRNDLLHFKQLSSFLDFDIFSVISGSSVEWVSSLLFSGRLFNEDWIPWSSWHFLLSMVKMQLTFEDDIYKVLFLKPVTLVFVFKLFSSWIGSRGKREREEANHWFLFHPLDVKSY